jgi:hypothetical protein
MKRLFVLALLGLLAGRAESQLIKITNGGGPSKRHMSGNEPPPLGPWYNYWPLEAHFQVPAMPEYPYWGAPQTMPVVPPAPYGARPAFGNGPPANGMGAAPGNGFHGYPGYAPNGNGAPPPSSNQPPAQMQPGSVRSPVQTNPYPALSGYPGYGYPGYGYYQQWQPRPQAAPNAGAPQRP